MLPSSSPFSVASGKSFRLSRRRPSRTQTQRLGYFFITMVMCNVMALAQSKLTAQGQISVPAEVRRRLGIGPGSVLEWDEEGERIIVRRAGRYSSEDVHKALFSKRPSRPTLRELKEGVREHIRKRYARR